MELGRIILRMEKARSRLLNTDFGNKKQLLMASRKMDKLLLEYYRAKLKRNSALHSSDFSQGRFIYSNSI
jgi:hypothetical protein